MHSLPVFLRLRGRPVIVVGSGEAAAAKRRLLERAGAVVVAEAENAQIAIIACDSASESEAAAERLRERGVLINVVDHPTLCDFTMPAIVDRDPLIVAIGTGGASAGLAKAVRQRIERMLPPGLGALAAALEAARGRIRACWPDARTRRGAIDRALMEGGILDPIATGSADAVDRWLAAGTEDGTVSRTETVRLTSADPDELTLRAARLLGEADRVVHDVRVPLAILERARADAVRTPAPGDGRPCEGLTVHLEYEPRQ